LQEIESFSGTVHVLVEVLDAQAKRIEHAKLKVKKQSSCCYRQRMCIPRRCCDLCKKGCMHSTKEG
jgi:hypothetical protein